MRGKRNKRRKVESKWMEGKREKIIEYMKRKEGESLSSFFSFFCFSFLFFLFLLLFSFTSSLLLLPFLLSCFPCRPRGFRWFHRETTRGEEEVWQ